MGEDFEGRKAEASAWFRALRDRIVAAFEDLEARAAPRSSPPARF
ncbi:MAG: coproporphyrinogen III oxidase, partial [Paracoccaceae bacterium]